MCMPTIPRMSVPADYASTGDTRYGFFSAANVIDDVEPHTFNGIEYVALCDPAIRPYPAPGCVSGEPVPNPEKIGARTSSVVTADPFVLYAADTCPPLGVSPTQARDRLRARIARGESHMVEYVVNNGLVGARPFLRDPGAVVLADGDPVPLLEAVGLLEHRLAVLGRVGVIHAPRWMAALFDEQGIIHRQGPQAQTFLGTRVVFGSGYDGRGPDGTDDTNTWLYATATPTVRRSPIVEPATWNTGGFNTRTNQGFLLAERMYVVDWPCDVIAVQTDIPRPAGLIPGDPALPPAVMAAPVFGDAPLDVSVTVDNHGNGPVTVDWGDGSAPVTVADGATATHTYADPGGYVITTTSQAAPNPVTHTVVTVTEPAPVPGPDVTVTPPGGVAPVDVALTADNFGNGPVTVDWGDGSPSAANPGDGTTASAHTYTTPGTYTVTVTSDADPAAVTTATVTVTAPIPDPVVVSTPAAGEAPLDVSVTVDNHGNGPVTVDYGDGSPTVSNPGDGATASAHTYAAPGTYTVTATSQEAPTAVGTATVNVAAPTPPAVTVTPDAGAAPLSVDLVADNHGNGPVSVVWGDATADGTNPGDGATATPHTYTAPGTYTATVASAANPAASTTATVTVTAPADPVVTADPASGVLPLAVSVTVDNDGNGPVTVDYGDGSPTVSNPGDGTTASEHTYTAAGTHTVTATSQHNPDAVGTATVTATVPADPAVTVAPTSGPMPLAVDVTADNHGNGPVTVDYGDGSPTVSNPGDGTTASSHEYTAVGTHTVTVTSDAYPAATGTGTVVVDAPIDPVVTATPNTGPWPLAVDVTVDNDANGPVTVDFGDGSPTVANPGDGTTVSAHTYTGAGPFTIVATSDAYPDAEGSAVVTPTVQRPTITADPASGPTPLLSDVSVDNHGNGPVMVDYGDGNGPTEEAGQNEPWGIEYAPAGEYTITATSVADPAAVSTAVITVGPQADPVVMLAPTPATPLSVDIRVDNHGNGTVDVDFGDGQTGTHPGFSGQINEHVYASAGTYTVTATSQADPNAVGSAQITVTA